MVSSTTQELSYAEKLRDPRWQRRRLEILQRDGWECQNCGSTTISLAVHHLIYLENAEPWDYPDHLLMTLCELCHERQKLKWETNLPMLTRAVKQYLRFAEAAKILAEAFEDAEPQPMPIDDIKMLVCIVRWVCIRPKHRIEVARLILQYDDTPKKLRKLVTELFKTEGPTDAL